MTTIERRLRIAGGLITIGLLIELVSLVVSRPTPFYFFLFAGGAAVVALGLLIYLLALVSRTEKSG
jgi:flagellar biosynthesis protein FliR